MANMMEDVVVLLVSENPKKPGSKSAQRFEGYKTGLTRQQTLKAGLTGGDIRWDVAHGHIRLMSPKDFASWAKTATGKKAMRDGFVGQQAKKTVKPVNSESSQGKKSGPKKTVKSKGKTTEQPMAQKVIPVPTTIFPVDQRSKHTLSLIHI